jgi:hypothetical protein
MGHLSKCPRIEEGCFRYNRGARSVSGLELPAYNPDLNMLCFRAFARRLGVPAIRHSSVLLGIFSRQALVLGNTQIANDSVLVHIVDNQFITELGASHEECDGFIDGTVFLLQ